MIGRRAGVVPGLGLALAAGMAEAVDWRVDSARSKIAFEYLRDGAPARGVFTEFSGEGSFDPTAPGTAELDLWIESRSIDLYDALASAFATSAEWFDSKNHPQVHYKLVRLTPLGSDEFEAYGVLTLRGQSKYLTSRLKLLINESVALAQGAIEINRADYLLGVGPSAAFVDIGPEVTVSFDLVAQRGD